MQVRTVAARNARRGVVERVRERRVVVEIRLVGEVGDVAGVDHDVERDLLHGLARAARAHVGESLLAKGHERFRAGVGQGKAESAGVGEAAVAGGVLDLRLLGERIADSGPEVLFGCRGDDHGIDEDVRGRVGVGIALEGWSSL